MFRAIAVFVYLSLAVALPTGASADTAGSAIRVDPDQIAELIYGVYCAEDPVRTEAAPETASGIINIVPDLPRIRAAQTFVPAALDIGFGVLARVPDGLVHDPVVVTVRHPPFPGSGIEVQRWTTRFDGPEFNLVGFSFDIPEELVPGTWSFTAHAGEKELFHVTFDVVPPELAAPVLADCQMGFTS